MLFSNIKGGDNMTNVHQFFEDTEGKGKQIEEAILKELFKKYIPEALINKSPNYNYSQLLQMLLFSPNFENYRNQVWEQLFQLDVNDRNIIMRFFTIINNPHLSNQICQKYINHFSSSPFLYHYEKLKSGYFLETEQGEIVAYKLDEVLNNPPLVNLIHKYKFVSLCHNAVEYCAKAVPKGYVITSEIASLFNYPAYHSYFEQEDYILDIAANTVYPKESFQKYYTPKELIKIPTEELANEIAKIPQDVDPQSQETNNLLKLVFLKKKR